MPAHSTGSQEIQGAFDWKVRTFCRTLVTASYLNTRLQPHRLALPNLRMQMKPWHRIFVAMLTHEVTPLWGSRPTGNLGIGT